MVVSELFLLFAILLNKRLILTYDEETSSANQHSTKKAWRAGSRLTIPQQNFNIHLE